MSHEPFTFKLVVKYFRSENDWIELNFIRTLCDLVKNKKRLNLIRNYCRNILFLNKLKKFFRFKYDFFINLIYIIFSLFKDMFHINFFK